MVVLRQVLGRCMHILFPFFFALPNPPQKKNQLTPQSSTGHRASHNPPTKAQKQTIGSQLPAFPTTSNGPQGTALQQYKINQIAYPKRGWPTYPMGLYNTKRDATTSPPITDWVAGKEPDWAPIVGGERVGKSEITSSERGGACCE